MVSLGKSGYCFHDFEEAARVDIDWTYAQFEACIEYLRENQIRVFALRDLNSAIADQLG